MYHFINLPFGANCLAASWKKHKYVRRSIGEINLNQDLPISSKIKRILHHLFHYSFLFPCFYPFEESLRWCSCKQWQISNKVVLEAVAEFGLYVWWAKLKTHMSYNLIFHCSHYFHVRRNCYEIFYPISVEKLERSKMQ